MLGLDEDEVERLRDRRRRQLAGDHRLEHFQSRLAGGLLAAGHAVDDLPPPQRVVDRLPFGEVIDGSGFFGSGHGSSLMWMAAQR